jgi:hypothetical protein
MKAEQQRHRRYSTYKLGLALLAADRLSPPAKLPHGLTEKLLSLQDDSGGWITDYDAADKKIGLANVETTCFAILGIDAHSPRQHRTDPSISHHLLVGITLSAGSTQNRQPARIN